MGTACIVEAQGRSRIHQGGNYVRIAWRQERKALVGDFSRAQKLELLLRKHRPKIKAAAVAVGQIFAAVFFGLACCGVIDRILEIITHI